MEASLWSPVVRQEDLLDAGHQSSVADHRFTGFLVPQEWDWLWCLLFQMVEMVCLHVISLMEALQECNSTIFVKVGTTYNIYRSFYIAKINMDMFWMYDLKRETEWVQFKHVQLGLENMASQHLTKWLSCPVWSRCTLWCILPYQSMAACNAGVKIDRGTLLWKQPYDHAIQVVVPHLAKATQKTKEVTMQLLDLSPAALPDIV